jgi:hypothetical protein
MRQVILGLMAGVLLLISWPVFAQHRDGHRDRRMDVRRDRHWEGRDIHRFGERDMRTWRGGHWYHGRHEGRRGWWWVAAGMWYFYPAPVYPYPDPYTPPVVINQQPPVVVAPQPQTVVPPQPPAQMWYYCDSAEGYYPYVSSCPEGWRTVPAQPPEAPPQ